MDDMRDHEQALGIETNAPTPPAECEAVERRLLSTELEVFSAYANREIDSHICWGYALRAIAELTHSRARITTLEREKAELVEHKARLLAMTPLFEEARDAITAIPLAAVKVRNISLSLADRMDGVGYIDRWKKRYADELTLHTPDVKEAT